ncbi:MAG: flagellar biosynthesis protein FlhF [Planctomycetia bacterium]|nr:flagellar biosynthesis protein FlhF [Planctomycetia bacterium]
MQVKKYRANTMQEALAMVSRDFGPNAMLMASREIRKPCFFGLSCRRYVEVTVADGEDVPVSLRPEESARVVPEPPISQPETGDAGCDLADIPPQNLDTYRSPDLFTDGDFFDRISFIHSGTVHDFHRENPLQTPFSPEEMDLPAQIQDLLSRIFTFLCDMDMDEASARSLVTALKQEVFRWFEEHHTFSGLDSAKLREKLYARVRSAIQTTGPIRMIRGSRKVVALVGPAGVGKTTTTAKLAAHYRLRENRRVGLITLDTFRMAAVEQLQTYASVLGVPMYVAASLRQIREAMDRMADFDLVLIDTAGRSSGEEMRMQELRAFLKEAGTDEVHLVLSSASRPRVLVRTAEMFASVGTTALIVTKLDESPGLGILYPLATQCGLPVSYVTHGQNVPDDFHPADVETLTGWILGEEPDEKNDKTEDFQYNRAA